MIMAGEGIAPDELGSLFDAFVQTETGRKSREGTGLGLPISRKFVQIFVKEAAEGSTRTNTGSETAMIREKLTALPPDLLTLIKEAAIDGNSERLHQTIASIRPHDAGLAEELTRLTDDFAFDIIINVIQNYFQED